MKCTVCLLFHLLATLAKPGGTRAVIAENLLMRQQLIIHSRSRQRAPNLTVQDRVRLGFLTLFLNPRRITRLSIIVRSSTLLKFHAALIKRKYRFLYSSHSGKKPGPKGPPGDVRADVFWTATDLDNKLHDYRHYFNQYRCHSSGNGTTPVETTHSNVVNIKDYRWGKHCRGLFELPMAA